MNTPSPQRPLPQHFAPERVGEVWRVGYQARALEARQWAHEHGIVPAERDARRIGLLLIDCQNTFCIPGYELFVAGHSGRAAVEDNLRLCTFIYRSLERITEIIATLDTHSALQIFHSIFLINEHGRHPEPMTTITLEDVEQGRWKVNPELAPLAGDGDVATLQQHLLNYCRTLGRQRKYELMVWPYHALLGGIGHAMVSAVEEACFFHSIARHSPTRFELKGMNVLTEDYSALRPEVLGDAPGEAIARKNSELVAKLLSYEALIIAGQAKSHCVAWTVEDLLGELAATDPSRAGRIYLLEDCTSPVVVPGVVDYTAQAERAFHRFAEAGMHVVGSTQPLESWPGMASSTRSLLGV